MSILIKDMEMPKSCLECRLFNDPWCMAKNRNQWRTAYNRPPRGEKQNDCPLIEVPQHGRLIDADALLASENQHYEYRSDSFYVETRTIELAPTVIDAESNSERELQRDYEASVEYSQHCGRYEPTYDPDTGAM